jgi:hypothetical protein
MNSKRNSSVSDVGDDDFLKLLGECRELAAGYPDGLVFIGGIAVYLHAINVEETRPFAEATHDGDVYISVADMSDLRNIEEVTPNRRLHKSQIIKGGFEFDIYTERQSGLIVPYDEIVARSEVYDGVRVASIELLFVLKLEAFRDRQSSAKGEKDAKDLLRLALIAHRGGKGFDATVAAPYLQNDHMALLERVERGSAATTLSRGNAKDAKALRNEFAAVAQDLRAAFDGDEPTPPGGSSVPRRG